LYASLASSFAKKIVTDLARAFSGFAAGSSPFGSLPPVAAIGYVTSTAAASTIHSSTGASWTVEEETFFFATLDENKAQRRGGTYNWTSVLERMKTFWIANKGPSFERSQSALKSRLDRRKNLEEVGLSEYQQINFFSKAVKADHVSIQRTSPTTLVPGLPKKKRNYST